MNIRTFVTLVVFLILVEAGSVISVQSMAKLVSEDRGVAVVSEEEMPDLKDSVQYILANMTGLNESANYVRVEYRALSGASIGYMVHFGTATGGEWAPTAYVYVPASPYYPQAGGFGRLSVQGLQKIVAEAQTIMAGIRQEVEKK